MNTTYNLAIMQLKRQGFPNTRNKIVQSIRQGRWRPRPNSKIFILRKYRYLKIIEEKKKINKQTHISNVNNISPKIMCIERESEEAQK